MTPWVKLCLACMGTQVQQPSIHAKGRNDVVHLQPSPSQKAEGVSGSIILLWKVQIQMGLFISNDLRKLFLTGVPRSLDLVNCRWGLVDTHRVGITACMYVCGPFASLISSDNRKWCQIIWNSSYRMLCEPPRRCGNRTLVFL